MTDDGEKLTGRVGRRWDDKAKRWQFKRWSFNDDKEHQIRKLTF
jgi:hypothetical protein